MQRTAISRPTAPASSSAFFRSTEHHMTCQKRQLGAAPLCLSRCGFRFNPAHPIYSNTHPTSPTFQTLYDISLDIIYPYAIILNVRPTPNQKRTLTPPHLQHSQQLPHSQKRRHRNPNNPHHFPTLNKNTRGIPLFFPKWTSAKHEETTVAPATREHALPTHPAESIPTPAPHHETSAR
jgi:hypothetical protein